MAFKKNGEVVQAKDEYTGNTAKYTYITELTPTDNRACKSRERKRGWG